MDFAIVMTDLSNEPTFNYFDAAKARDPFSANAVGIVLCRTSLSQITDAVVATVSVYMVKHYSREPTVHIEPCQHVRSVTPPVHPNKLIGQSRRWFAYCSNVSSHLTDCEPVFSSCSDPSKNPSHRVIVKGFQKPFVSDLMLHAITHTMDAFAHQLRKAVYAPLHMNICDSQEAKL